MDIAKFIEEVKGMTVLELNELVKAIENEFGVSAAATAVVAGPAQEAAPVEEKTEFKVSIKEIGANKIGLIKIVREFTGLGLVEAKKLVEDKGVIKESATKEEADDIAKKVKEAGGEVAID